jgi:hypothetical protein
MGHAAGAFVQLGKAQGSVCGDDSRFLGPLGGVLAQLIDNGHDIILPSSLNATYTLYRRNGRIVQTGQADSQYEMMGPLR